MEPRLEVAEVFRRYEQEFLSRWGDTLSSHQRKAFRDICACRTAALGARLQQCDHCSHQDLVFQSCRNRACPKCQSGAREKWLATTAHELLPVPYSHVTFTLPHQLCLLALQNPRLVYGMLFQAASQTLLALAADPRRIGAQIAFLAVLHTWEAPVIEPGRTDIGSTVSTNSIANVALVSRNPYNFILIQPNVSGSPNVEFGVPRKVNANGFADRINYQIDGGNNTQSDRAGIRLTPFSNTYIAGVQQVNNGFAPEFGNTVGTVFNAITKSGTNEFHGEGAYIFRRTDMVARSTLLARTQPKPIQNLNDEFFDAGGPVIKDKLFFFGAWEHVNRDLPMPVTVSSTTITTLGLPANFANAIPFSQNVTFVLGKGDYQITQNHRLSARYSYFRNESPYNNGGGLTLQSQTYLFKDRAPAVAAQLISTFGPSLVNEFRFGIPRRYQRQVSADFTGAPPTINISGVANFGASDQTGVRFIETT